MAKYHVFCCFFRPKRIKYIKYFFPLSTGIFTIYILFNLILTVLYPSIVAKDIFLILLLLFNFGCLVLLVTFYIKFVCRETVKYDYEERGIRSLALVLILAFGLMIGLFLVVIGIFAAKISTIDAFVKMHQSHVVHFNE
jgi:hypothetical protein